MPDSKPEGVLPETARLLAIVARLRGPGGCPWDREQTLDSLKPHLLEECYELLEAVDSGDPVHHREELGDVLLQVALQAQMRAETGLFDFEAVARALADKLVHRHPHVFGDVQVANSDEVLKNWDAIKAKEKKAERESALDGIPQQLPALLQAQRLQARAARVGFDWPEVAGVLEKIDEELREVREAMAGGDAARVEGELGDLLFSIVNFCRFQKVDAEQALRGSTGKFVRRFREIEARLKREGRRVADATLEELSGHWEAVKAGEG